MNEQTEREHCAMCGHIFESDLSGRCVACGDGNGKTREEEGREKKRRDRERIWRVDIEHEIALALDELLVVGVKEAIRGNGLSSDNLSRSHMVDLEGIYNAFREKLFGHVRWSIDAEKITPAANIVLRYKSEAVAMANEMFGGLVDRILDELTCPRSQKTTPGNTHRAETC